MQAKVALITGAARRIGAEIARTLHAEGVNVLIHYHTSKYAALDLCKELNESRPNSAHVLFADLLQLDALPRLIEEANQVWKRLDILINNASRFYRTPIGSVSKEAWEDLLNSNLTAPFFLSQAAAPILKQTQGVMINIIDIHANRPMRGYSAYCIAKSGLAMMTKVLAKELGPDIRVNGVAPGSVMWPEGENSLSPEDKQKIIKRTALQKAGSARDIAKAVLFLALSADYITGHIINVDGGRLLYG
jgi:pteridine reductase